MTYADDIASGIAEIIDRETAMRNGDGMTFRELRKSPPLSRFGTNQLREYLREMVELGELEAISTTRPDITGKMSYSVVYRVKRKS